MAFDSLALHPILQRNLALVGFERPRPIQAKAIDPLLAGRDVIGLAQTGTGKTAAYLLPMLHHLISRKPSQRKGKPIEPMSRLRGLVLCPTRELAQQVARDAAQLAQGTVLRTACAYGKSAISPQAEAIARGVDLLIATPGRVRELLDDSKLSLTHVRYVTVDEADRMLDMGFLPQVKAILDVIPADRQTGMFSATMPSEVEDLARTVLREPVRIEVGKHTTAVEHVKQRLVPVNDRDKVSLLLHLLQTKDSWGNQRSGVLVFCRTKRRVGWVGTALDRQGIKTGMLHGDRSQAQRTKALTRFSNRELRVLVATDVAARGLHVEAVKTVVNYDLPMTPEEYVHRIGRAAHGEGEHGGGTPTGQGEAYTLLSEDDRSKWRAVLDTAGVEVFAETVEGFTPTVSVGRRKFKPVPEDFSPEDLRRLKEAQRPRRSKKGRPIKKGEKPGGGVRKIAPRSSTKKPT